MALPFHTTRWSLVARAGAFSGGGADSRAREALDELVRAYWPALFAFARSRGHGREEAADLVQGFFARVVEKGGLVPRERRARFRAFLLAAFQHFAANEGERAAAARRGGGMRGIALDELAGEERLFSAEDEPVRAFERRYARRVLERALATLRTEQAGAGQSSRLALLEPHLVGDDRAVPYLALATQLGASEGALKVAVHRLRRRFGELLRAEVAGTLTDPAEIDAELGELMAALAR
jgi:RNA polymerase sigma-70 factor (ECF subfamily)